MLAVYATHAAPDDPLSALSIGDMPEPIVPGAWARVKVSHASLNRHDLSPCAGSVGTRRASPIRLFWEMMRSGSWKTGRQSSSTR